MNLFKEKKNYYEILGVSDSASQQEIEEAFKLIDEYYNPEKVSDLSPEKINAFSKAKKAYETLSDVSKRKKYDRKLFDDVDEFEYEDSKDSVETNEKQTQNDAKDIQPNENKKDKLTVYPKSKDVLGKNKYRLIAGGLVIVALVVGYKLGKATSNEGHIETSITETDKDSEKEQIQEEKLLTAENIDEKVQEILADNQSKGLNIDSTFIKSALFITNIDYLSQDDIKTLYGNTDLNMIEEIQNMYNYTSAVGTHNVNLFLGQKDGEYITLSNLAYIEQDILMLKELENELFDLIKGLKNKEITEEEFQNSFYYITKFYDGQESFIINGTEYSNYSFSAGGGLLSEQYWPVYSLIYQSSEYINDKNYKEIKTLSYGTEEEPAVINGSKYLGSIVNHESLQCLEDNQELENDKTLTKTQ